MQSITIYGKRWHDGFNTYNTAEILIDGKFVHKTPFAYGYEEHYKQIAQEWLDDNGYLPGIEHHENGSTEPLWRYAEDREINFRATAIDVPRKKDL